MNYSQTLNDIVDKKLKTPEQIKVEQQKVAENEEVAAQKWERLKQSDESFQIIERKLEVAIKQNLSSVCFMAADINYSDAEVRHRLITLATQRDILDSIRTNASL